MFVYLQLLQVRAEQHREAELQHLQQLAMLERQAEEQSELVNAPSGVIGPRLGLNPPPACPTGLPMTIVTGPPPPLSGPIQTMSGPPPPGLPPPQFASGLLPPGIGSFQGPPPSRLPLGFAVSQGQPTGLQEPPPIQVGPDLSLALLKI